LAQIPGSQVLENVNGTRTTQTLVSILGAATAIPRTR
jgi:hypothetical protein